MKRDARIELFRCLCMFGVCLLHALDQGGYADTHRGLDNLMTPSVVGFIFISGWFGITLRVRAVLKLLGIGLYCALAVTLVHDALYLGDAGAWVLFNRFWGYFSHGWFLWAYLALMLLADLLKPLFDALSGRDWKDGFRRVAPLLFLVFFWSYAATKIPGLKNWTPIVGGFGGFGVLTFLGIYAFARICRVCSVEARLSVELLLGIASLSGGMCWIGFMHYHSPFALVFAGALFLLFRRLPELGAGTTRFVMLLAPSMFSVYLLHNNTMGMFWLRTVETCLIGQRGTNYYVVCFLVAMALFIGGILLDFPRRFIIGCYRRMHMARVERAIEKVA